MSNHALPTSLPMSCNLELATLCHNLYKKYFKENEKFEIMDTPDYARNNNWLNILRFKLTRLDISPPATINKSFGDGVTGISS